MRWSGTPATRLPAGHDVKVKVGDFLQTRYAIVLVDSDTIRGEGLYKCFRGCSELIHNFIGFNVSQVQYRGCMSPGGNKKLPDFKLPRIDERKCLFR